MLLPPPLLPVLLTLLLAFLLPLVISAVVVALLACWFKLTLVGSATSIGRWKDTATERSISLAD